MKRITKPNTVRACISQGDYDALQAYCKKNELTLSEAIRLAIQNYLANDE